MTDMGRREVTVVTGAGSGIGRAAARILARDGRRVAVADANVESARDTVSLIEADGGEAAAFHVDVTDQKLVEALRDDVIERLGNVRALVNNAGWSRIEPFLENDPPLWEQIVAVNLLGTIRASRAFLEAMVEAGAGGYIVNVASDAGRVGSTGEAVYSGAKGGVLGFTKALARESARHGVTVNCVCPGPTDTPLLAQQSEKIRDAVIRAIPFRRVAKPEEIGEAIAFFASERASYITGQVLSVSGGLTMSG